MHSVINLIGWFVFNIAIPLFAPLALLPLLFMSTTSPRRYAGIIRFAIRDGQLLWAAIPMSASGCYMLAEAMGTAGRPTQGMWLAMVLHVSVMLAASVLVMTATRDAFHSSKLRRRESQFTHRTPSSWTVVTAISGAVHFGSYVYLIRPI